MWRCDERGGGCWWFSRLSLVLLLLLSFVLKMVEAVLLKVVHVEETWAAGRAPTSICIEPITAKWIRL